MVSIEKTLAGIRVSTGIGRYGPVTQTLTPADARDCAAKLVEEADAWESWVVDEKARRSAEYEEQERLMNEAYEARIAEYKILHLSDLSDGFSIALDIEYPERGDLVGTTPEGRKVAIRGLNKKQQTQVRQGYVDPWSLPRLRYKLFTLHVGPRGGRSFTVSDWEGSEQTRHPLALVTA